MKTGSYINGQWLHPQAERIIRNVNPADTNDVIAEFPEATTADVQRAIDAAQAAFPAWKNTPGPERGRVLWRAANIARQRLDDIARTMTREEGKVYKESKGEALKGISLLEFYAGEGFRMSGKTLPSEARDTFTYTIRRPLGVVGSITPWNYPLMMAVWKIGPALAAGCTVVLKPAPGTPLTTLLLGELIAEAGIPAGVVNIVSGGNETGQALVEHPDVRMVSITGSTGSGKKVMATASQTLKRVHLELGGKAPVIVFDDADPEWVAAKATLAATFNTGQDCTAATRVYVAQSKLKTLTEALVEAMKHVKIGAQFEDGSQMGPLISAVQRERVQGFVDRAQHAGAKILIGGRTPTDRDAGYYFEPTVIADADQKSEIIQSEIFGPVLTISAFNDDVEAVRLGNDVLYGLAASVFTRDVGRAMKVSSQLEFGTVWINDHIPLTSETPHGGFKQSGFGKDLSAEAMSDYQITKHVMIAQ